MNLKKSDKTIAVVGVAILIIAAIGVILYVPEEGTGPEGNGYGGDLSYNITATPRTGEEIKETYQLNLAKAFGKLDYKSTGKKDLFTLDKDNVEDIVVEVKYTDAQPSFPILSKILNILGKGSLGIDELSVTIIDPDENKHVITLSGGKKNVTIHVSDMISKEAIEDVSEEAAEMQLGNLTAENSKWNGQVFQVNGQLTIKGKLGFLARIRERFGSDSFTITVNYIYYEYELEDPIEEQQPPTGFNARNMRNSPWASMSLGGFR